MRPEPRPASVEEILAQAEWVRRLALGLVGNEATADDLTQEALMRAIERPPIEGHSLRAWFARVVRNLAIDQGRRRQRRRAREDKVVEGSGTAEDGIVPQPGDIQARLELQEQLAQAVRDLPEPYRTTTVLYYFDQLGTEEIAARLELQTSTVRNQLSRARARLRTRLEKKFGGDWRALCIGLLLRPTTMVPPPPPPVPAIPASFAGAIAAALLLAGAWILAGKFQAEPLEASAYEAGLPVAVTPVQESAEPGRERVSLHSESGNGARAGLEITDLDGNPVPGAQVRAYGARWHGTMGKLLGPERNQFERFPLLEQVESTAAGFAAMDLLDPRSEVVEPRIALVIEAPGFVKRLVTLDGPAAGEPVRARVSLQPAQSIYLQIVDEAGRTVPGATASFRTALAATRKGDFQRVATDSDGRGQVACALVPFDADQVYVTCPGYRRAEVPLESSQTSPERPQVIVLERGGEASVAVYQWDGQPFAGAEVYLVQQGEEARRLRWTWSHTFAGRTGDDGFLRVGGIDPSRRCRLAIKIDGVEVESDELLPGEHASVFLPPLARIRGTVMQHDGVPAAHALVGSFHLEGEDKRAVSSAWADDDGNFELTVEAGLQGVGVWHQSGSVVDDAPRQIAAGEVNLGQISLPLGRTILVQVLDEDGSPYRGEVQLAMRKPLNVASSEQPVEPGEWRDFLSTGAQMMQPFRLPDGRFAVTHLPQGEHEYSVISPQHQPARVHLDAASSPESVEVRLQRAVPVAIRLKDVRGEPVVAERLVLFRADYDWGWAERTPPVRQEFGPMKAQSDRNGLARFGRIGPGSWILAREDQGAEGIELARFEIPIQGLDTEVVVEDPATLAVQIAGGAAVEAGSWLKVSTAPARAGAEGVSVAANFDVPSNGVEVKVAAGDQTLDFVAPNTLPRTVEVSASGGEEQSVTVEFDGTDWVGSFPAAAGVGRVLLVADQASALPSRDAFIHALRDGVHHDLGGYLPRPNGAKRGLPFALTRVNAEGRFRFSKLPDGRYRVLGTAPGLQLSQPLVIRVQQGEVAVLNGDGRSLVRAVPDSLLAIEFRGLVRLLARYPGMRAELTVQRENPHPESSFNQPRTVQLRPERSGPEFSLEKEPAGSYQLRLRFYLKDGTTRGVLERQFETFEGQALLREVDVTQQD